ncbi:unnamed protein product [Rotaria socialis]|uniref:Peptide-methionine (R)-S-oxide reductase n=2 Tax=Rotaria socialis TaxID=392032 RepID=A0A820IV32_9BILA|nr:unnamed protein product [Rotaria socialis]CAF3359586.1 unnamed protein product [Rotaria socialis]CAF3361472.1 unnamed protein product [Rotaria socialis]CAF3673046.1 unnamed protein product [Rotaria socialis]CAF3706782.1 unnamed protein product [Rotaria socialis]
MSASAGNKPEEQNVPSVNLSDDEWKKKLTDEEYRILRRKDTEYPGTGKYDKHFEPGTYECAGCGQKLYDSSSKFDSHCGWPAFSSSLAGSVKRHKDEDGYRIEILCHACDGHLGHVFTGEGIRDANGKIIEERHCVNSASLKFSKKN